jgi:heat shock protein 5
MVKEAEAYAEEDRRLKERIESRNGLESYLYNLKNAMENDSGSNLSAGDKKELLDMVDETLDWMDQNPGSGTDDYDEKRKEVEQVASPIMRSLYSSGTYRDKMDDLEDEEL